MLTLVFPVCLVLIDNRLRIRHTNLSKLKEEVLCLHNISESVCTISFSLSNSRPLSFSIYTHLSLTTQMDNTPDGVDIQELSALNYDDTVAYEEQIPTEAEVASLAKRIGNSKVYLLSESSAVTRVGKVRL